MQFDTEAKKYNDPEKMAAAYLVKFFGNQKIEYPINPFQMLKDEGVLFSLMNFKKLEGVYIPASSSDDVPAVGIITCRLLGCFIVCYAVLRFSRNLCDGFLSSRLAVR